MISSGNFYELCHCRTSETRPTRCLKQISPKNVAYGVFRYEGQHDNKEIVYGAVSSDQRSDYLEEFPCTTTRLSKARLKAPLPAIPTEIKHDVTYKYVSNIRSGFAM